MPASPASWMLRRISQSRSSLGRRPCLAGPQRPESIAWNLGRLQSDGQLLRRLVNALVGEPERAPMVAQRLLGLDDAQHLHGIVRVHVLRLHEPARLIGPDGQMRESGLAETLAHGVENLAVAEA